MQLSEPRIDEVVLTGRLAEFKQALKDEIDKIEKSGQSSTLLSGGRKIEGAGSEFWYRFRVEYLPNLPADTPCKLIVDKDTFDVTVISFGENTIIIASKKLLPPSMGNARLENGTKVLMERLIKRIETTSTKANPAGERLLRTKDLTTTDIYSEILSETEYDFGSEINDRQSKAIISALTNDTTYIWGPPGTGKTKVIGTIINHLLQQNRSVLLVSHTNVAVDQAIIEAGKSYNAIYKNADSEEPYPFLRFGIPAKPMDECMMVKSHVDFLGKELYTKEEQLRKLENEYRYQLNLIATQISKWKWVEQNQLEKIGSLLNEINRFQDEAQDLRQQKEVILRQFAKAESAYVSCQDYPLLQRDLNLKENQLKELQAQHSKAKLDLEQIPQFIQDARDEVIKHDKYVELKAAQARELSVLAQKKQISEIAMQIEVLNGKVNSLTLEHEMLTQTIDEYQHKNALARLFSQKIYTQANNRIVAINQELPELQKSKQVKSRLHLNHQTQLDDSMVLQEQLNTLTLHETKEAWQNKIEELNANLEKAQKSLPNLQRDLNRLNAAIIPLRTGCNISKKHFNEMNELKQQLDDKEVHIIQKREKITKRKNECTNLLDAELSLVESFCVEITPQDAQSKYDALKRLLEQVKIKLSDTDIAVILAEEKKTQEELSILLKELSVIERKMSELEKQVLLQAKVIGTTLTKSYLSDTLYERSFDTVILDEASIASIPALWCASLLAEKNIVIVGDFKQLSPIVLANTTLAIKWLGTDIFNHSGMQERMDIGKIPPDNFIVLNEQYRMEEEIADIANTYYSREGVFLKSNDNEIRRENRKNFYQWYAGEQSDHSVHLIDTKNLHAWVTGIRQGNGSSRLNFFSAALCVDLAFRLLEKKLDEIQEDVKTESEKEPSILIIAPYKPHVTKINQLIEFEYKARGLPEDLNFIKAGTVHSNQGNEADIVIFDLVIDEPHWRANLFMTKDEVNKEMERMFNVAVTRAKFKLFIVGNFSYCQKKAKNNALSNLLKHLIIDIKLPLQDAKILFLS